MQTKRLLGIKIKQNTRAAFIVALFIFNPRLSADDFSPHIKERLKMEKKLKSIRFKDCQSLYKRFIEKKAKDANALCRPDEFRAQSKDAKVTLRRLNELKRKADRQWRLDKIEEQQSVLSLAAPHEQNKLSYALLTQYLFSQRAMQCTRFNDQFSDAIILVHQIFPKCRKNIGFESYRHAWRSNNLQKIVYQEISGDAVPSSTPYRERIPSSTNNR